MNRECRDSEQAIWELARSGRGPEGHIEHCKTCLRAFEEARKTVAMLRQADCVPEAPDCRAAVMSRLQRRRPVLAYVFMPAAAAGVLILGLVAVHPLTPTLSPRRGGSIAVNSSNGATAKSTPKGLRQEGRAGASATAQHNVAGIGKMALAKRRVVRQRGPASLSAVRTLSLPDFKQDVSVQPTAEAPEPSQDDDLPPGASIAVVIMDEPEKTDDSFSYSVTDVDTGRTFTCAGERKGNSISVYAEQIPGRDESGKRG